MMSPFITTFKRKTVEKTLGTAARVSISNVPTIIRRGGGRTDVREYISGGTAEQLFFLQRLARLRAASGETDIRLDFKDDASEGRRAFASRELALRERHRRRYVARARGRSSGSGRRAQA